MYPSQKKYSFSVARFLRYALALTGFLLGASACTQIITGVELPHDKRLVIRGELIAGEPVRNILIGQTLPPLDTLYYEKTLVTDAEAFITVDGRQYALRLQAPGTLPPPNPNIPDSLQPRFIANSLYEAPDLLVEPGKTYRLTVRWRQMQAEAETFVPVARSARNARVQWDSIDIPRGNYRGPDGNWVVLTERQPVVVASGEVSINGDETMTFPTILLVNLATRDSMRVNTWQNTSVVRDSANGVMRFRMGGPSISSSTTFLPNGTPIRTDYHFPKATTRVTVRANVYDRAFEYFQLTSSRMFPSASGPFGGGGANPVWNVRGDGIGFFVGRTEMTPIVIEPAP